MGLMQILSSPSAIKLAMAASGVECARIDYDRATDEVVLSIVVADRVHHYRLACKATFTREEIAAWLSGDNPPAADLVEIPPAVESTS